MGEKMTPCAECGMPCEPGEYHPYAACLMFKGCHNSTTVRANLTQPAQAVDAVSTELRTMRGEFAKQFKRAERAEALLREAESELRGACLSRESARISQNIRAHLSENSRG